jgi:hypothetical protein
MPSIRTEFVKEAYYWLRVFLTSEFVWKPL